MSDVKVDGLPAHENTLYVPYTCTPFLFEVFPIIDCRVALHGAGQHENTFHSQGSSEKKTSRGVSTVCILMSLEC